MMPFREWYIRKYGAYPGVQFEHWSDIMERMADAMADYIDEIVAEKFGGQ
jgi:hypothetical protein